ncbi:fungal-specific transcription factor domain-containing protein [Circinella umbellata]|nr:fungal-specific transcription factor domain-containing protein [Circinella umbellata]
MNDSTSQFLSSSNIQCEYNELKTTASNRKSCDHCRKKKVRCNSHLQQPCNQCKKAGVECTISKRKKTSRTHLEDRISQLESLLYEQNTSITKPSVSQDTIDTSAAAERQAINNNETLSQQQGTLNKIIYSPWMKKNNIVRQPISMQSMLTGVDNRSSLLPLISMQSTINMIQEIPNLTPELTEKLIERYFNFIHPRIPMIDKRSFLIQYYYQHPQPLNRLLFYAILAVGCQFLPKGDPSAEMTMERKIGRHLREKAMDVMQIAYKQSKITTLQTLLMMAMLVPNSANDEGSSTNWLILGAAIRMSQDLEIFREDRYQHLSRCEVELRRRLAYSIYMWDKYASAATGKPFTVRDEDFYVQVPSTYEQEPDDGINLNSLANRDNDGDNYNIPKLLQQTEEDIRKKRSVYELHVQSIPMSQMISQILVSLYLPKLAIYGDNNNSNHVDVDIVMKLNTKLDAWRKAGLEQATTSPSLYPELFETFYNVGVLLLYLPLISNFTGIQQATTTDPSHQLLDYCNTAAVKVVEFIERACFWGLPFLKDFMMTQCATVFLQNCNNEDNDTRLRARKNLRRCASAYKQDDIVCKCQNAVVLDELSNQLPHEEESDTLLKQQYYHQQEQNYKKQNRTSTGFILSNNNNNNGNMITNPPVITATPPFTTLDNVDEMSENSYIDMISSWQKLQQQQQQMGYEDLVHSIMMKTDDDNNSMILSDNNSFVGIHQ